MTKNQKLLERRTVALPRGIATAMPVFAARAENAELWDVEGRRYVDFASGIGVLNVGHCHPQVMDAVRGQLDQFTHTAFQVMGYAAYVELAERINQLAPIEGVAKSIFLSTGAEAVENAIKIARAATGRSAVIAFSHAFHGRTFMTLAMTGKTKPYKQGFGPLPGEVFRIPFPVAHEGVSVQDTLDALQSLFHSDIAADRVAALIVEPVQGEGGFHPVPDELMRALRAVTQENGIVLIADEIQSGFARTGRMFAVEHSGVKPDLITMAKSLAGGLPLSGVVGRAALMDAVEPGGLGGTYAGSPLACVAALKVLDVIDQERLMDRAMELGERVRKQLVSFAGRQDMRPIGHVRGRGSMIAFDLLAKRGGDAVDPVAARQVLAKAHELGLVLLGCGAQGEAVRLLFPLTISHAILDEGMHLLEQALTP